jgi:hypothetical protein
MAQVAAQVTFALAPGLVGANELLNYKDPNTIKLYKAATDSLPTKFDLKPENLKVFLSELELRASCHGWSYMFDISHDQDDDHDETSSLLKEYGRLSKKQVHDEVKEYMGEENRTAQDDNQIYVCLMNSLSKEAKDKMLLLSASFSFDGMPSGIAFLKSIISESHVDTNATLRLLRARLNNLDEYMSTVDSDITKFNQHVNNLLDSLAARGAKTEDLLSNLFKGYAATSDKSFCTYIKKKEEDYDEGKVIPPVELMFLAENKYKAMVEGKIWKAPDEQMEQIIALQAQVKKLSNAPKSKGKGNKDKSKGGGTPKKQDKGPKVENRKPDWMLKKPSEGQPQTKKVNAKTYHWCPNHNSWTIHTPAECKGRGSAPPPNDKPKGKSVSWDKKTNATSLKIAQALQAIANSDCEDDSSEE